MTATVKNQPATPLPWVVDRSGEVIDRHDDGEAYGVADFGYMSTSQKEPPRQNCAYAVHACNAYPKLVAALQSLMANGVGQEPGLGASLKAHDLLRELGEAS